MKYVVTFKEKKQTARPLNMLLLIIKIKYKRVVSIRA